MMTTPFTVTISLLDSLMDTVSTVMDYAYKSSPFMALISCIMALVVVIHVKSATDILGNLHKPKRSKTLVERLPSPVNIMRSKVFKQEHLQSLNWCGYKDLPPAVMLENNGKTVIMRISCTPPNIPFICGGSLPGSFYFVEATFKWGCSEHSIDSKHYAMEMQVLHATNLPCPPYEYLSVSYLFALSERKCHQLDQIVDNLWAIQRAGSVIEMPPFDLSSLMWSFSSDYFSYRGSYANGSILLPSHWVICPHIFSISPAQLATFRGICDSNGRQIAANARKSQPLGERCVALNC